MVSQSDYDDAVETIQDYINQPATGDNIQSEFEKHKRVEQDLERILAEVRWDVDNLQNHLKQRHEGLIGIPSLLNAGSGNGDSQ